MKTPRKPTGTRQYVNLDAIQKKLRKFASGGEGPGDDYGIGSMWLPAFNDEKDLSPAQKRVMKTISNLPIYTPDARYAEYQDILPYWQNNIRYTPIYEDKNLDDLGSYYSIPYDPRRGPRIPEKSFGRTGRTYINPSLFTKYDNEGNVVEHETTHAAFNGSDVPKWMYDLLQSTNRDPKSKRHENLFNEQLVNQAVARQSVLDEFGLPDNATVPEELSNEYLRRGLYSTMRNPHAPAYKSSVREAISGNKPGSFNRVINYKFADGGVNPGYARNTFFNRLFNKKNILEHQIMQQYPALYNVGKLKDFHIDIASPEDRKVLQSLGHNPEFIGRDEGHEKPYLVNGQWVKRGRMQVTPDDQPLQTIKVNHPRKYTTVIDPDRLNGMSIKDAAAFDFVGHALHDDKQYNDISNKLKFALMEVYGPEHVEKEGGVDAYVRGMLSPDTDKEYSSYRDELKKIDPSLLNEMKGYITTKHAYGGDISLPNVYPDQYVPRFDDGGPTGCKPPLVPHPTIPGLCVYPNRSQIAIINSSNNTEEDRYEPSQMLNNTKAILSGIDAATGFSGNPFAKGVNLVTRAINSGLDGYTAIRYALDGQGANAATDAGEALIDLLRYRKGKKTLNLSKNNNLPGVYNKKSKLDKTINSGIKVGRAAAAADDFMHSSLGRFLFGDPDSQLRYAQGGDISLPNVYPNQYVPRFDEGGPGPGDGIPYISAVNNSRDTWKYDPLLKNLMKDNYALGNPSQEFNYDDYYNKANIYLSRPIFKGTTLTAKDIAGAAQDFYNNNKYVYPLDLLLTQGQIETGLGTKLKSKNNFFNVGNTDAGATRNFKNPKDSVYEYMNLMYNDYLNKGQKTPDQLLEPNAFVNYDKKRYASNPNYEATLAQQKRFVNKLINPPKKKYAEGGNIFCPCPEYPDCLCPSNDVEKGIDRLKTFYSKRPANIANPNINDYLNELHVKKRSPLFMNLFMGKGTMGYFNPRTNNVGYLDKQNPEGFGTQIDTGRHEGGHKIFENLSPEMQKIIKEAILPAKTVLKNMEFDLPNTRRGRKFSRYVTRPTEFYTRRNQVYNTFDIDPSKPITREQAQQFIDFNNAINSVYTKDAKAPEGKTLSDVFKEKYPEKSDMLDKMLRDPDYMETIEFMNSIKSDPETYMRVFNDVTKNDNSPLLNYANSMYQAAYGGTMDDMFTDEYEYDDDGGKRKRKKCKDGYGCHGNSSTMTGEGITKGGSGMGAYDESGGGGLTRKERKELRKQEQAEDDVLKAEYEASNLKGLVGFDSYKLLKNLTTWHNNKMGGDKPDYGAYFDPVTGATTPAAEDFKDYLEYQVKATNRWYPGKKSITPYDAYMGVLKDYNSTPATSKDADSVIQTASGNFFFPPKKQKYGGLTRFDDGGEPCLAGQVKIGGKCIDINSEEYTQLYSPNLKWVNDEMGYVREDRPMEPISVKSSEKVSPYASLTANKDWLDSHAEWFNTGNPQYDAWAKQQVLSGRFGVDLRKNPTGGYYESTGALRRLNPEQFATASPEYRTLTKDVRDWTNEEKMAHPTSTGKVLGDTEVNRLASKNPEFKKRIEKQRQVLQKLQDKNAVLQLNTTRNKWLGIPYAIAAAPLLAEGAGALGITGSALTAGLNSPLLGTLGADYGLGALTWGNAMNLAGGLYSANQFGNPNSALRQNLRTAYNSPTFENVTNATADVILNTLGVAGSPGITKGLGSLGTGLLSKPAKYNPFAGTFAGESKLPSWFPKKVSSAKVEFNPSFSNQPLKNNLNKTFVTYDGEIVTLPSSEKILTKKDFFTKDEIEEMLKRNMIYQGRMNKIQKKFAEIAPNKSPIEIFNTYPDLKKEFDEIVKFNRETGSFQDKFLTPELEKYVRQSPTEHDIDIRQFLGNPQLKRYIEGYLPTNVTNSTGLSFDEILRMSLKDNMQKSDGFLLNLENYPNNSQSTLKNLTTQFEQGKLNKYGGVIRSSLQKQKYGESINWLDKYK